jgi:RNA ligase (TIGR02306 family)
MSTFKVEAVKIDDVQVHPNADKLELLKINDWQCVSAKGNFKPGDIAIYLPIDSILPAEVETKIFGENAKVKLTNSRVKTIKLRGAISQGLAVTPSVLGLNNPKIGQDYTSTLKITKYEPVEKGVSLVKGKSTKKQSNPHFRKYTSIENAKNYPNIFEDEEQVVVTEKIHGTNARFACVPFHADTVFKRIKQFFGLAPKYEFVYGSHNVQLQSKIIHQGYYGETLGNVYAEAAIKYNLKEILKPGEAVYGEIYGDGIQKGYQYGCAKDERKLVLFDVMVDGQWLDVIEGKKWVESRNLPYVPVLYVGPFIKDKIYALRDGDSVLAPSQKVREGVVVKSIKESPSYIGRKMLKFISDLYLLKNQDDETIAH